MFVSFQSLTLAIMESYGRLWHTVLLWYSSPSPNQRTHTSCRVCSQLAAARAGADSDQLSDAGIGNPVGELQESTQKKLWPPPIYEFAAEQGPPHAREFVCTVTLWNLRAQGKYVCVCHLYGLAGTPPEHLSIVERGSSVVERRTRSRVSPGSNPPLLPFRRLGICILSIDAPVDSAV